MSTKIFLGAVVLTYVLPLIMLFIGIFAGSTWVDSLGVPINNDLAGVLLGFVLMALSYIFISKRDKEYKKQGKIKFEISKILN